MAGLSAWMMQGMAVPEVEAVVPEAGEDMEAVEDMVAEEVETLFFNIRHSASLACLFLIAC